MRKQTSSTFGLLLTDVKNTALADLAMSFVESSDRGGYVVMAAYSGDSRKRQSRILQEMTEHRLDGIVLSPAAYTSPDDLSILDATGTPHVLVTRKIKGHEADYVGPDNVAAGRYIGEHLAAVGVRSVAFVGGASQVSARGERLSGLRRALSKEGIRWNPALSVVSNAERSGGIDGVTQLSQSSTMPDAIVGYSDAVAFGVLAELTRHGIAAGRDVAVAAYDNSPEAEFYSPPLTSVDTFMGQVGARAVETLMSRLAGRTEPITELIQPVLHVRYSTAAWREPDNRKDEGAQKTRRRSSELNGAGE
jgi:LacI family transcriptional regulator